jgi:starvation-inducible outer membrane lipoprotein
MIRNRVVFGMSVAILALVLTGCPERKRIGDITSDPGRYANKEVTVVGRVTGHSYGALDKGVFEVDDGTGRIWVLSEHYGVPSKDTYVGVTGRVVPGLTFGGRNYATALRETKRRTSERR